MKKMKKLLSMLLLVSMVLTMLVPGVSASEPEAMADEVMEEFYVSPNGSDSNDGTQNAPFQTLEAARDAVRKINSDMTGDIYVRVLAGQYYFDHAMVLDERDSGSNGYQVIWESADGIGEAELIGGKELTGWIPTTEDDVAFGLDASLVGKVYKLDLGEEKFEFNALYVQENKVIMARTPNYKPVTGISAQHGGYNLSAGGGCQDMIWRAGDLTAEEIAGMQAAQARGENEIAQLYVWDGGDWDWFTNTVPLKTIDAGARRLTADIIPGKPELNRTRYPIQGGARYYLQGNLAFLDVEGEYHYNKAQGVVYFYPENGADPNTMSIIAPQTQEIIRMEGSDKPEIKDWANAPDPSKQVSNVTLDGFALRDTEYARFFTAGWNHQDAGGGLFKHCPEAEGSTQPAGYEEVTDRTEFKVGAITLINTNHITVQNCSIHNTGLWGIAMWKDNQYNTVKNCDIGYTGYGAITMDGGFPGVGKYCNNHTFENLRLHDVGQNIGHAGALTVMSTSDSTFRHLDIRNTPRRALTVLGGWSRLAYGDQNYDSLTDCYTYGNLFEYINIDGAEQDSGEDSGVFFAMLMHDINISRKHGTNAVTDESNGPNLMGYKYYDIGKEKHNVINQMLINHTGAGPTMRDKNSSHGFEFAMGAHCTEISNVKSVNAQSNTLALYYNEYGKGNGMDGIWFIDNVNQNYYGEDDYTSRFQEDRMEYDQIGTTEDFPFAPEWDDTIVVPEDLYFGDDFDSGEIDLRKWTVEGGKPGMDSAHVAEGPNGLHYAMKLAGGSSSKPATLSRKFENDLNKIVEVKFFDKYQDYAGSDRNGGRHNVLFRADNGDTVVGIGADGNVGNKNYFYNYKGERVFTDVERCFGWHTFKMDYSSGESVKLYIDGTEIAELSETSFNYVAMSSWSNNDRQGTFDRFYIYGGQEAPPVEELPDPKPPVDLNEFLYEEDFEDSAADFTATNDKVAISYTEDPENAGNQVMRVVSNDGSIYLDHGADWSNYVFEACVYVDNWNAGTPQPWDNFAPAWYVEPGSKGPERYSLKYRRDSQDYALYKRAGGDDDFAEAEAPALSEFNQVWHDYKIVNSNGVITAYIDGDKIFEEKDTAHQGGTIGFDGINVEYYVDDIRVTTLQTAPVEADVPAGPQEHTFTLHLSTETPDAVIFYTVDGTDPKVDGIRYDASKGIDIKGTTTVKAVAKAEGMRYSELAELLYDFSVAAYADDFEDGEADFVASRENINISCTEDPTNAENTVMKVASPDGSIYLPFGQDWANYTFECRVYVDNWNAGTPQPWDNFAPSWYVMPGTKGPERYALKYNRDSAQYALYKRTSGDDDFATATAPALADFNQVWHDYKISITEDGKITTYIDGVKIFEEYDTDHTNGTIGFDGINVVYYVDDIKVTTDVIVEEADKAALGEAVKAAEAITNDNYTDETWDAFQDALNAAKDVLDNENATQTQVDAAKKALEDAIAGLTENKPHEHAFGDWTETKAPTCTEKGEETRSCACGETETREVEALGHTPSDWIIDKAATETEKGSKHKECTVCHVVLETAEIPATGVKQETVVVRAVVNGDKSTAKTIFTGKAPHGANLIEWLNTNVKVEDRTGYEADTWYNWDWFGHKHNDKATVNGWTNVYVNYNKLERVIVKAVVDSNKDTAEVIWTGYAKKGVNLVEFLNKNVKVEDREGYTVDKWYNWDWFGHKHSEKTTVNGWTNVYVTYNKIPMVNVVVKAVENGDKSTAKTIWSGKAPKGANLVEWLTANVEVDVAEGYDWDKTWMNYDWFGHKFSDTVKFNGWTNVYVNFTNK